MFEHHHYWVSKTGLNTVRDPEGNVSLAFFVEGCRCGAVRSIEYVPGQVPVIRMAENGDQRMPNALDGLLGRLL